VEGPHALTPGNGERCGACHREHNGPDLLVDASVSLCTDCHSQSITTADADLDSVQGFSEGSHPKFRITLPVASREGALLDDWQWTRTLLDDAIDDSKLVFDHEYHLDPGKVEVDSEGRGMICADCHVPGPDDKHFEPITMETTCASCHELTFDKADSERLLPHTEAREVIKVMEGHFIRDALEPADDEFSSYRWRRIPDREDREYGCKKSPLECARETLLTEVELRFAMPPPTCAIEAEDCVEPRPAGCLECHEVVVRPEKVLTDRYQVVPALLTEDFYPAQRFDHFSHAVMEDNTGDDACLVCHAADRSAKSEDLLMPDIDTCLGCHRDSGREAIVETTCVACHGFHPRGRQTLFGGITD